MSFLASTSQGMGTFDNSAIRANALSGGAFNTGDALAAVTGAVPGGSPGGPGGSPGGASPGQSPGGRRNANLDAIKGGALLDRREVDALLRE